jgi:hypothetical protein
MLPVAYGLAGELQVLPPLPGETRCRGGEALTRAASVGAVVMMAGTALRAMFDGVIALPGVARRGRTGAFGLAIIGLAKRACDAGGVAVVIVKIGSGE